MGFESKLSYRDQIVDSEGEGDLGKNSSKLIHSKLNLDIILLEDLLEIYNFT